MNVIRGNDGQWCASGNGYLRPIVAYAETEKEAKKHYAEAYFDQQRQEYHFEQSMGHLSDVSSPNWTTTSGYEYEQ